MRKLICIIFLAVYLDLTLGCHHGGHRSRGSSVDGTRKKRQITPNPNITVVGYFPLCVGRRVNESINECPSPSYVKKWEGPVSFVVYHTVWYKATNTTCDFQTDTVECWLDKITKLLRRNSPSLAATQRCIVDYYEEYHGIEEYVVKKFPNGDNVEYSEDCANVSKVEYEQSVVAGVNSSNLEENDVAFSPENIDDLISFAQNDLHCAYCTASEIDGFDEVLVDFNQNRGTSCWYTSLAAEIRQDSAARKVTSELAIQIEQTYQAAGRICPKEDVDFSVENVIVNVLQIEVICGTFLNQLSMSSCGLFQLGYARSDEVFVGNAHSTTTTDSEPVHDDCFAKLTEDSDRKLAVIEFRRDNCNGYVESDGTYDTYHYALRNKPPEYHDGFSNDQRVHLDLDFSCSYSRSEIYSLPISLNTSRRTVSLLFSGREDPIHITMIAYRDENFSIPITVNITSTHIPDPVWIRVVHDAEDDIFLDLPTCWLKPDAEDAELIYIISDGCSTKDGSGQDSVHNVTTCVSRNASFMFNSVYTGNYSLGVFCEVEVFNAYFLPCKDRPDLCDCEQICGCDDHGKTTCSCHEDYTLAENGKECLYSGP